MNPQKPFTQTLGVWLAGRWVSRPTLAETPWFEGRKQKRGPKKRWTWMRSDLGDLFYSLIILLYRILLTQTSAFVHSWVLLDLAWPIRFCSGPVCWHPSAFFGLLLFWKQFAWSRCLGMKDSRHPVTQTCWSKHLASVVSYLQSSHSNHTNARTLLCHAAFFFW